MIWNARCFWIRTRPLPFDVVATNADGPSRALLLLLSPSVRTEGGGLQTAVASLGKVEAWLDVYGKGANLPPASQSLFFASAFDLFPAVLQISI